MKKLINHFDSAIRKIFIILFICICVWFVIAQIVLPSEQNPRDFFVTEYNDNWFHIDNNGEKIPFKVPGSGNVEKGKTAIFLNTLPDNIASNMWLCFRTSRQDMSIYINNELRESYSTKESRPFGVASASTYLFVQLFPSDSLQTIEIHSSSNSTYSGVMRTILLGDKTGILFRILKNNFWILLFSVFMFFLGLITIIASYLLQYQTKQNINLRHLGWCVTAVSLWILTQSNLRQLFFPNVSAVSSFSEFMKFLIPIPFAQYMDSIQNNRYHKYYAALEIFSIINFVISTLAIVLNLTDHTNLHINFYFILGILIVLTFITIIMDLKNKKNKSYSIVAYGIFGVLITCIIQILLASQKEQLYNINMVCIGFIFMVIMAFIQTILSIINQQKALYESEAKAQFLAGMSHEIRTPINAVLGIDEMIAKETTEDNIREYAQDIQTAGKSLLAIINDILDFSKIESGKMRIINQEYDLSSVINDSCSIVKVKADEKGLDFNIICDETLPSRLIGDEVRIRQILINLLSNAVKYTKEGSITFSISNNTSDIGDFLLILSVKDTGIGIKEENIPYLFDSFSRIEENDTHKIEGTGLGLNIVRNLVELMNGTITVESKYSKGSTFTVNLPQKIASDMPIGNLANTFTSKAFYDNSLDFVAPKAKILVVDDVPINLKVFCGLIKDTLIKVDTAKSGRECITKLNSDTYNIIFLDDMMPELNGVETLKKINSISEQRHKNTPVIMLTANAVIGAKEEYLQKGFNDYLSKPIQKNKLINLLKLHLPDELIISKESYDPDSDSINLDNITFLNTEAGLSYYGGDKEFYLEIIEAVLESDYYEKIQNFYEKKDWRNYQITVHSLKSSTKSIGAEKLSEMARQLEFAAKENDVEFIYNNHDKTMAAYIELLENIRELFKTTGN